MMMRRRRRRAVLTAAALVACLNCRTGAIAMGSSMGSLGATAAVSGDSHTAASPADRAQHIKEQATALHRAGEYEEAAREFARAAELLEAAGGALAPPPTLSAIRLSLAAAQLKCGDLRGAEATCSQLLRTPGLPRPLRQKASYRRSMSRKRQAEAAGVGAAGSRLAQKAYRDAYLSLELSQGRLGAGPTGGDAKALRLVAEMESGDWGQGRLTEADRTAARSTADKHLVSLASATPSPRGPGSSGGLFDILGGGAGGGIGGKGEAGFGGLGGGGGNAGSGGGMPGLMDMLGPGMGGTGGGAGAEGVGGLMSMLMGGGGVGANGLGGADGADPKQMLKMAKKMGKVVKKQLRNPGTQQLVCSFLNQAKPETIMSLADAAGFPGANEAIVGRVSTYLQNADGKTLESWVDYGEIASGVYRRLSQLAVLWSRGIALAGVWLIWVWIRACFAPIVAQKATTVATKASA